MPSDLQAPPLAFAPSEGEMINESTWTRRHVTKADCEYVKSCMVVVRELGKFANYITPPTAV